MMIREYRAQGVFNVVSINVDKVFDPIKSEIKGDPYKGKMTMCDVN